MKSINQHPPMKSRPASSNSHPGHNHRRSGPRRAGLLGACRRAAGATLVCLALAAVRLNAAAPAVVNKSTRRTPTPDNTNVDMPSPSVRQPTCWW